MHLKNPLLFGLMAILLLGGTITPVLGQTSPEQNILINEVETNPKGSDAGFGEGGSGINSKSSDGSSGGMEFVELYNDGSQDVDISGWSIVPSASWKTFTIPENTVISSNDFVIFSYVNYWFKDFGETISLYDSDGNLIDNTPLLVDKMDDSTSWQRVTDGLNTNSDDDWELKRISPKSSNGKITIEEESEFFFNGSTDKTNYTFGEYVIISGSVSEKLYIEKPIFAPEIIKVSIDGPNYFKNIALYPQYDLSFSTTLNIQKVYGFDEGDYKIKLSYGEYDVETSFSISDFVETSSSEGDAETLEITTDKESYLPGETVIVFADTNSSLDYGGLDYTVTNPNGEITFEGTIFPNEKFSTVYKSGSSQLYPFSTQLFMSGVNPVYGTYEINGTFKPQNAFANNSYDELSASTTFILAEDVKEDTLISLTTDKAIYSIDDVIKVTGRSNDVWVEDLELRVIQTGILSSTSIGADSRYVAPDPFVLHDRVRLNGDGTFEFEFKIVDDDSKKENYSSGYGDYRLTVSEYFGDASVIFKVVENPDSFIEERTPLGLKIDNSEFVLGTPITISGTILDYDHKVSNNLRNYVELTFQDSNNNFITYADHQGNPDATNCNTNDCAQYERTLIFTAIPDAVGSYEFSTVLYPGQFDYGQYTVKVTHPINGIDESKSFAIISAQDQILTETETKPPLVLNFEKDVYNVGEKLVITGNVILKNPTSLTSTYADRSSDSQTSDGHSYSTNYAQAAMNYVEVSIPYPKSMTIAKNSNYQTTPNENENYTGGGGSGEGGSYYKDANGNIVRGDVDKSSSRGESTGYDGQAVLKKQKLLLTDMNFKAYPDENGDFSGVFDLRAGIFGTGTYVIHANYFGHYTEHTVKIIDNSLKGGSEPEVVIDFDKSEYVPGETARITGQIKNAFYYDSVSVIIETPDVSKINCFSGQQCGFGNTEKKIRVQETVDGPKFYWNYKIPSTSSAIGTYNVVADTHFGKIEKEFFVLPESEVIGNPELPSADSNIQKSMKKIDKFNRISDNEIPITLGEKSSEESTLMPRVLQGSLFTSARGEESDVNLRISTSDGQCIIGQDSNCLVSESTRKPGAIYSIVSIDDVNYKIRYSGNDVRLEKFSIVPEESNSQIDIDNWKVEIIKDEQPTRFYYKVSYIALE